MTTFSMRHTATPSESSADPEIHASSSLPPTRHLERTAAVDPLPRLELVACDVRVDRLPVLLVTERIVRELPGGIQRGEQQAVGEVLPQVVDGLVVEELGEGVDGFLLGEAVVVL